MDELDLFKILVTVFDSHTKTVNTLWGIFYAISLALLGFIYKSKELWENKTILAVLSVGFIVFSFGNSQAINRSQTVLEETSNQIINLEFLNQDLHIHLKPVANKYKTVCAEKLRLTSIIFSILVIVGMWAPYISLRIRTKKENN